jgi:hypothetical protein
MLHGVRFAVWEDVLALPVPESPEGGVVTTVPAVAVLRTLTGLHLTRCPLRTRDLGGHRHAAF